MLLYTFKISIAFAIRLVDPLWGLAPKQSSIGFPRIEKFSNHAGLQDFNKSRKL